MTTKVAHNKKGTPGYFEWLRKCRQTRRMRELDEMMEAQYLARYLTFDCYDKGYEKR